MAMGMIDFLDMISSFFLARISLITLFLLLSSESGHSDSKDT